MSLIGFIGLSIVVPNLENQFFDFKVNILFDELAEEFGEEEELKKEKEENNKNEGDFYGSALWSNTKYHLSIPNQFLESKHNESCLPTGQPKYYILFKRLKIDCA